MAYTTVNKSTDYFNTKLYTGDGNSTQAITGVGHQPDLVWLKNRSDSTWHQLIDAVRGTGATYTLASNSNEAEGGGATNQYGFISAIGSDGFTVSAGSSNASVVNHNGNNYASWNWKANGAGSTNTDGSINSTVSANTTAGFSIVKFTTPSSGTMTIGHGLGAVPKVWLHKRLDGTDNWQMYHQGIGNTKKLMLNSAGAEGTSAIWQNTTPTNSLMYLGDVASVVNASANYIAYCFAEKTGYSKFGSYVGNGSSDGPFINLGFAPSFVMTKNTAISDWWGIWDNKRLGYNSSDSPRLLFPHITNVESTSKLIDFTSNGFKIRSSNTAHNGSGNTVIYMAFGQSIVGSNNVPCTAR